MKAYHFLQEGMMTAFGDEPPWSKGEPRTWEGKVVLCVAGYHSSPTWLDALEYAPGPMACIVDVSKPVEKDDDKQVSKTRTLVDYRDATRTLHQFACDCAEHALKTNGVTDERIWNAPKTKRLWLDGKATDKELDDARGEVWLKSRSLAKSLALAAVWSAIGIGSATVPMSIAAICARQAARHSARQANNHDAELKWQRQRLDEMMAELFQGEESGEQ